jgi:hypothetical protein
MQKGGKWKTKAIGTYAHKGVMMGVVVGGGGGEVEGGIRTQDGAAASGSNYCKFICTADPRTHKSLETVPLNCSSLFLPITSFTSLSVFLHKASLY